MSVDRALSKPLGISGRSIVEATVYLWIQPCQDYCVSVDGAFSMLLCVRGQSIAEASV